MTLPPRIAKLDHDDPLAAKRLAFDLPDGVVYLDGNSLGALPRTVHARLADVVATEWGGGLIRGWNQHKWIDLPKTVGDRIAPLIGAPKGTVAVADSTSINVFKAVAAALALNPERRVILSDTGNFPTDLYVAQGLAHALGREHQLKLVDPVDVADAVDETTAVLMLTHVDYRTGRLHDMTALTDKAHAAGAVVVWDLAHSAGALPVDIAGVGAEFAVGCGYKYLNGGPGAPAFIYVRRDVQAKVAPFLTGWMGHAKPFAFDLDYRPARGIHRMTVGTPPVLGLVALDEALKIWRGVDIAEVRAKSMALGDLFVKEVEKRCGGLGVELAGPRRAANRGSQVSFRHPEGYAVVQALIAEGVIGDFRAPDIMRFGFAPLYTRYADVYAAAEAMERVLRQDLWRAPKFRMKSKVT